MRVPSLKNMRLRTRFMICFFLLSLVPLFTLGIYSYNVASLDLQERTRMQGAHTARRLNERFNELIEEAATVTRYLIGDPQLEPVLSKDYDNYEYPLYVKVQDQRTLGLFINHIMDLHLDLDYFFLYPLNQAYVIGYSNNRNVQFVNEIDPRNQLWFKNAVEADGYWVYTGLHEAEQILDRPNVISVSRLIKDSKTQQPLAVVSIMIDQRRLIEILQEETNGGSFLFIADSKGNTIARSLNCPPEIDLYLAGGDGAASDRNSQLLVSSDRSYDTGWTVYVATRKTELLSHFAPIKQGFMIIIVFTVVVSIYLSFMVADSLVRPLKNLKRSMAKVKQGQWEEASFEKREDEIGELIQDYEDMVQKLKEYVAALLEEERNKRELEFKSLQAQINPHFVYNTLNAIKWSTVCEDPEVTTELIDSLIYILRFVSKRKDKLITVREERQFLERYLAIMRIRYPNRFDVCWTVPEELTGVKIPLMILQPVVENAILHGLEREEPGKIWIRIRREDEGLVIEVQDNGVGMKKAAAELPAKFSAVGLDNVEQRIKLIYGESAHFDILSEPDLGTTVVFQLPLGEPVALSGFVRGAS